MGFGTRVELESLKKESGGHASLPPSAPPVCRLPIERERPRLASRRRRRLLRATPSPLSSPSPPSLLPTSRQLLAREQHIRRRDCCCMVRLDPRYLRRRRILSHKDSDLDEDAKIRD